MEEGDARGSKSLMQREVGERKARDRMKAHIDSGSSKSDCWESGEGGKGAVSFVVAIAGPTTLEEPAAVVSNGQRC